MLAVTPWTLPVNTGLFFGAFSLNEGTNMSAVLVAVLTAIAPSTPMLSDESWVLLLGALAGVVCYAISGQWNGTIDRFLIGSSAGAMSVMGALLALQPKRKVNFFGVLIIDVTWLVVFIVLIDLIGIRQGWNIGGHLAHWGGLLVGFLAGKWGKEKKENRHLYQHRRPKSDDQFNEERLEKERKLNAILDKINRSGFDSLSKSEKDFLNQQSR
jgi:membrane associated rhomboid family serine protease